MSAPEKRPLLHDGIREPKSLWSFITQSLTEWRRIYNDSQNPKWAFITKIFFIVFLQLLIAAAISTSILHDNSAAIFFKSTWLGIIVYILICLVVPAALILIHHEQKNLILFLIFILALGSAVGLVCVYTVYGKVVQQTLIITAVTFMVLTLYAFFATFIDYINKMFVVFILGIIIIIGMFILTQKCHDLVNIWPWLMLGGLTFNQATVGAVASIVYCGYVIWDTNNLAQNPVNAIWSSMNLYLDVALKLGPFVESIYGVAEKRG